MKVILFILWLSILTIANNERFKKLWYDGNAELSSYQLTEMRYGEERNGYRIMVFVTEPLCLTEGICKHLIKPDTKVPEKDHIRVIKLNDIREFNTGIYNYNVMTSVFSSVEDKKDIDLGNTVKISFTSQEWCGTVFERLVRKDKKLNGVIYSYFQADGDKKYSFSINEKLETEENLWILIRELNRPFIKIREKKEMKIIPSMWYRRKTHKPASVESISIIKGKPEKRNTQIGVILANKYSWKSKRGKTIVWVESEYPNRILSFIEPDGSNGEILASIREPYWKLHENKHEKYRKKLKIK